MGVIEKIPVIANPELLDKVIFEIQKVIADKVGWLDYSFGKCQRLVKSINGKRVYTPNVYAGGNEYMPLAPDSNIGNFSFFYVDDPQYMDWIPRQQGAITTTASLIVWYDLRKVYPGEQYRNTERAKADVLKAINNPVKFGRVKVNKIFEKAENIYRDFSLDEIDNQFLMHPYAGIRIECELFINENC